MIGGGSGGLRRQSWEFWIDRVSIWVDWRVGRIRLVTVTAGLGIDVVSHLQTLGILHQSDTVSIPFLLGIYHILGLCILGIVLLLLAHSSILLAIIIPDDGGSDQGLGTKDGW